MGPPQQNPPHIVCPPEPCPYPLTNFGHMTFPNPVTGCAIDYVARFSLTVCAMLLWSFALVAGVRALFVLTRTREYLYRYEKIKLRLFIWTILWFMILHGLEIAPERPYFFGIDLVASIVIFIAVMSISYFFMLVYPFSKALDSLLPFAIGRVAQKKRTHQVILNSFRVMFVFSTITLIFPTLGTVYPTYNHEMRMAAMFLLSAIVLAGSVIYIYLLTVIIQHMSALLVNHPKVQSNDNQPRQRSSSSMQTDVDASQVEGADARGGFLLRLEGKRQGIQNMLNKAHVTRIVIFLQPFPNIGCFTLFGLSLDVGSAAMAYMFPISSGTVATLVFLSSMHSYKMSLKAQIEYQAYLSRIRNQRSIQNTAVDGAGLSRGIPQSSTPSPHQQIRAPPTVSEIGEDDDTATTEMPSPHIKPHDPAAAAVTKTTATEPESSSSSSWFSWLFPSISSRRTASSSSLSTFGGKTGNLAAHPPTTGLLLHHQPHEELHSGDNGPHLQRGLLGKRKKHRYFIPKISEMTRLTEERQSHLSVSENPKGNSYLGSFAGANSYGSPQASSPPKRLPSASALPSSLGTPSGAIAAAANAAGASSSPQIEGDSTAYYDETTGTWKLGGGFSISQLIFSKQSDTSM